MQKAEAERAAREKAEQERLTREEVEQERRARQKAEEDRLAAQYTEGIGALTADQWEKALRCFERLEAERPGYRDAGEQVARLRRLNAAMERATAPPPSRLRPGTLPEGDRHPKPGRPRPGRLPEERPSRLPEE